MVDFAYLNLHLEGRPTFESECDVARETCCIIGQRGSLEIDKFDRTIRGRLMEHGFRDALRVIRHPNLTDTEFSNAVRSGGFTFLYYLTIKKNSFRTPSFLRPDDYRQFTSEAPDAAQRVR